MKVGGLLDFPEINLFDGEDPETALLIHLWHLPLTKRCETEKRSNLLWLFKDREKVLRSLTELEKAGLITVDPDGPMADAEADIGLTSLGRRIAEMTRHIQSLEKNMKGKQA